jgi:hypothetical protein
MESWNIKRLLRIVLYTICLVSLVIYGYRNNPAVTLQMCLDNPDKYNGTQIEIGNEIIVYSVTQFGFVIKQMDNLVEVRGETKDVEPHEYIVLKAVFQKGPWLELKDYHVAKRRRAKVYISVFPVIFIFAYFLTRVKFTKDGLGLKDA